MKLVGWLFICVDSSLICPHTIHHPSSPAGWLAGWLAGRVQLAIETVVT